MQLPEEKKINKKIAIFYKTYIFTPSGEKEIMVVQGINEKYELLASKFNGVYTTWNLICKKEDAEVLATGGVSFYETLTQILVFFDNASLSRDKECVNLFSEHIKIASLPISWEEFKYLRDGDMPLSVEVMA